METKNQKTNDEFQKNVTLLVIVFWAIVNENDYLTMYGLNVKLDLKCFKRETNTNYLFDTYYKIQKYHIQILRNH